MKSLIALILIALVLIVAINAHNRRAEPQLHPAILFTSIDGDATMTRAVKAFLTPLAYAFWYLGFNLDARNVLIAMTVLSWWLWVSLARTTHGIAARLFGVNNPDRFVWWSRILLMPWRPVWGVTRRFLRWRRNLGSPKKATARFARWIELMYLLYRPGDTYVGRIEMAGLPGFQPVGWKIESHEMMFGMTGAYKSSILATKIALHRGSSIVIDPAGGLTKLLFQRNSSGGPGIVGKNHLCFRLDPFGQAKGLPGRSACWNPLDEIDRAVKRAGSSDCASRVAASITEALIVKDPGETKPFFPNSAKGALLGIIMFTWVRFAPGSPQRTLVQARKYLQEGDTENVPQGTTPWEWLLFQMSQHQADHGGVIASTAHWLSRGGKESTRDILSTALSQTVWLSFPEMQRAVSRSDFSFEDFKVEKTPRHLTICGPISDFQEKCAPFARLVLMMAIETYEKTPFKPRYDTILIADELPLLNFIPSIFHGPAHLRKHHLRFLGISQDVSSLKALYSNTDSLLGNADVIYWLQSGAESNVEELKRRLGVVTVTEPVDGGWWSSAAPRNQMTDRPLMYDNQITSYLAKESRHMIVTRANGPPLRLAVPTYFRELPIYFYQKDEEHREFFLRALTRWIWRWWRPGLKATP